MRGLAFQGVVSTGVERIAGKIQSSTRARQSKHVKCSHDQLYVCLTMTVIIRDVGFMH